MEHDFYSLFSRFWWLIFPLFWMGAMVMGQWSRHARANRALDILKSYADQGKDPPPDLLKSMQAGRDDDCGWGRRGDGRWRYAPQRLLQRTFLFTAFAIVFGIMAFNHFDGNERHGFGYLLPFAIFVALALSNGLSLLFAPRLPPPSDTNGPPR